MIHQHGIGGHERSGVAVRIVDGRAEAGKNPADPAFAGADSACNANLKGVIHEKVCGYGCPTIRTVSMASKIAYGGTFNALGIAHLFFFRSRALTCRSRRSELKSSRWLEGI